MASNTVGINISMKSNIPQVAKESADALRNMSTASADMQKALSIGGIEAQYKEFADRINKYHDSLKRIREEQRNTPNLPSLATTGSLFRRAGSTVAGLGATGDVVGAGADVGNTIGGMFKGMGAVGGLVGGGLMAATGLAFAGNALEKVYEKQINTVMKVTAQLGELGKTGAETSKNFGKVMDDVTAKAAKMGMTFEQGAAIYGALATGGGRGAEVGRAAADVMRYSRAYGVDTGTLSNFMGLGLRFGLQGGGRAGIMGYAAGQVNQLGLSQAQLGEVLQAQTQMFESALGRGVVKSIPGINAVQSWLGGMGKQYQGQYGLNVFNKMDTAIAGATKVQSQADIIKYQAASSLLGGKGTYIDVMKQLEKGATVENINAIKQAISGITGGNKNNAIELIRQVYGVSYTTASNIWKAPTATEAKKIIDAKVKPITETPEMGLLKAQNRIMGQIRDLAKELTPIKAGIYEGADKVVSKLTSIFGVGTEGAASKAARDAETKRQIGEINKSVNVRSLVYTGAAIGSRSKMAELAQTDAQLQALFSGTEGGTANRITQEFLDKLTPEQKKQLNSSGLFAKEAAKFMTPNSLGGRAITLDELATILADLTAALSQTTDAVKENSEAHKGKTKVDVKQKGKYSAHYYGRG